MDYEKALKSGKVVFLDFYANWCPICRGEGPELHAGFNALNTDKLVGFRVNYNDTDTDANEKKLAQQLQIPYQHYKVIIKDGKAVYQNGDTWDREMFVQEIGKFL